MKTNKQIAMEAATKRLADLRALPDDEFVEELAEELYFITCGMRMGQIYWDELPDDGKFEGDVQAKNPWRLSAKWAMKLCGRIQARPEI